MNIFAKKIAILGFGLQALLGAACIPAMAQEKPKLTVVTGIDPSFSYLAVAVKGGFFEREGIDAQLKAFDDGNVALDNLLTGNAEIGSTSEVGTLVRIARGAKISVVGTGGQAADLYGLVGRDSIKSPADLVGKTVGMPKGSGGHLYFGNLIARSGVDPSKITVKFLQSPEAVAALSRGDIDAMAVWEPWLMRVQTMVPGMHVISRTGSDKAYFMNVYILFTNKLVENKDLSTKAMRAIVNAANWIPQNFDEAVKIVAQTYRMDPTAVATIMKMHTWNVHFDKAEFVGNFDAAGKFAMSQGLVKAMPDYDAFLQPSVMTSVAPDRAK